MKKIWFLHHYATLPNLNGHIRPYRFAVQLEKRGFSSVIFAASYQHFSGSNLIDDRTSYIEKSADSADFVFIRTPSESGGAKRVANMLAFYRGLMRSAAKYAKEHGRPDVIIASSPQPLAMLAGVKLAGRFGVPCICEVRDLWPEAIFYASSLTERSLPGRILTGGEHSIYRRADAMIFTKPGDTDYLRDHGWMTDQGGDIKPESCFYINNGVDLPEYKRQISENAFDDPDLDNDCFKVIYAGAIRMVNSVENILDAARLLRGRSDIRFLIYGDGDRRAELEKAAADDGLDNVVFKGFVEKKYIPYILSRSSVNLLNYSDKKYNWAHGNSSNKLFEYMASGKPVISTVKTGYSIIEKYGFGTELEEYTPQALADAILDMKDMPGDAYGRLCSAACEAAEEFDYSRLTERLVEALGYVGVR